MPAKDSFWALTEKEKLTLRLIVRGHDAKSIARSLDLSVHTINERLRDARRKMAVSSSREAARLLLKAEGGDPGSATPDSLGDAEIGEDASHARFDQEAAPIGGAGSAHSRPWIIIGGLMMLALALLAITASPQILSSAPPAPAASRVAPESEAVDFARNWLTLVDQGRWEDSYRGTGAGFQKSNTLQVWTDVSQNVRAPLGAMISRTLLSQQDLPAPPHGYKVVKFRTHFANKDVIETVTLEREDGAWHVVGVMID